MRRVSSKADTDSPEAKESPKEATKESQVTSMVSDNRLELAIGREVRAFRKKQDLTVNDLAKLTGLSTGMLSKIERGIASPSLATLRSLSAALQVPVTAFFRKYEEQRDATFVKAGEGLVIERRGTRAGHQYQLLGHSLGKSIAVEPYLITLTKESEVFPVFQHEGMEFIYMLEGRIDYRYSDKTYELEPGDSLFFDADAPHGPEELLDLPIRFLSIIVHPQTSEE
jgi:transcriptional regulator with XRE-family HTH domain